MEENEMQEELQAKSDDYWEKQVNSVFWKNWLDLKPKKVNNLFPL